jgi:hypothetical protein
MPTYSRSARCVLRSLAIAAPILFVGPALAQASQPIPRLAKAPVFTPSHVSASPAANKVSLNPQPLPPRVFKLPGFGR